MARVFERVKMKKRPQSCLCKNKNFRFITVRAKIYKKFLFRIRKYDGQGKVIDECLFSYQKCVGKASVSFFYPLYSAVDMLAVMDKELGPVFFVKNMRLFDFVDGRNRSVEAEFITEETETEEEFLKKASMYTCIDG